MNPPPPASAPSPDGAAARRPVETEFKLSAVRPVEVAAVDAALRELGVRCRAVETRRQLDTYLDDDRGSLARAGIGLRLRDGKDGARVGCKTAARPERGLFVRPEREAKWTSASPPTAAGELPGEVRDAIEPFVLGRALAPVQQLAVQRDVRTLTMHGHELCELAIDHVEARANGRTATFQEVELEVFDDVPGNERLAHGLVERLPLVFADRDKPTRAATLLGIERPRAPDASTDDAEEPVARVVLGRLTTRLLAMRAAEVGVREDRDPECVHRMRVAIRRMRSLARAFRKLWPTETGTRLLEHLGETGRHLGAVRDLDVMLEKLPAATAALPPQLHEAGGRAIAWVRGQRDRAQRALQDWLRSPGRLDAAARLEDDLAAIDLDGDRAREPLCVAAPRRLAKAVARLREHVDAMAADLPIEPAHRLRLAVKRVRYLAEEFAALPGHDGAKALRRVVRVQQAFGELCDHEVAAERLLGWVHAAAAESADPAWTAAALGGLAANHHVAAAAAREHAAEALRRLDKKRVWARLAACSSS